MTVAATLAVGSVPATVRTTIRPAASARAPPRGTSRYRPTTSCPIARSRSGKGAPHGGPRIDLPTKIGLREMARRTLADRAHDARAIRGFSHAAQHQLPLDHGGDAGVLPGRADPNWHRAG